MTALTADREPPYKQGIDLPYQLAASTTIYAGSLVMLDGGFSTRASQRGIWQGDCGSSPRAGEKQQHDSRQSKRCGAQRGLCQQMAEGSVKHFRFKIKHEEPAGLLTLLGCQIHWAQPYHGPAKAKAVAGNTPFSLSWEQEDLFPGGVWGSAPQTLGENKRRGIDPVLTTIARGWTAPKNVGTALFPDVSVPAMGGKIISFGDEAWRDFDTVRAPGARAAELQMGYEGEDFALQRHSMDAKVPREWMQDAHQHSQQSKKQPQQN